jgi:glycosyltransferase involved in cell wall biosynthesis
MSLMAAVSFWQEAWAIERCLASIRRGCPNGVRIVAVDGAYAQFPHATPESTDGSLVIAERLADEVIRCPGGQAWPSEITKRNAYLSAGREGDTVLMVDADEELYGFVPSEIPAPEMDVRLERDDGVPPGRYLRLFRWRPGLRYEGTHHALWDGDRLLNATPREIAPGFWLKHYYEERGTKNAQRTKAKAVYYGWLAKEEAQFRQAHVLI